MTMLLRTSTLIFVATAIVAWLWQKYPTSGGDTTAVVLNWSRRDNVVQIAALLCGPDLKDVIANVFIWNNSPKALSAKDFPECPKRKLTVYNSPSNELFYARFLACARATTQYCFIQDDDFLVLPPMIHALHSRISSTPSGIYLLPSYEMLSTSLRNIRVNSSIHTGFSWLGHGAMLHRSTVVEFLELLAQLNLTASDLKMADNYFSILANVFPEVWFDQGIELGGGEPFTVGVQGDEHNRKHIIHALELLERIIDEKNETVPYVSFSPDIGPCISRAPCCSTRCIFETSISLLPDTVGQQGMLEQEAIAMENLGPDKVLHYVNFPPSKAVDGLSGTVFKSPHNARNGEYIQIDALLPPLSPIEMVFLVDDATEKILRMSNFSTSRRDSWVMSEDRLNCINTDIESFRECSLHMVDGDNDSARFRVTLEQDVEVPWRVAEIWLRTVM
ncbi:hypothetical protein C8J56DRAFT_319097 [Mycena floridula]|nr:hypothetical protein C8J56DRAFT_319097 [Mycena floridula]